VHFGLGPDPVIKRLTVRWPRGEVQVLENLPADQLLTIAEPPLAEWREARPVARVFHTPPAADALFTETAARARPPTRQHAAPVDEFTRQRLLPRRLNASGRRLAVADVNGDGLDDVFVSGTAGQAGELFLGQPDGNFVPATDQPWASATAADDNGAVFLDVTGHGHPDLLIAAGASRNRAGDPQLTTAFTSTTVTAASPLRLKEPCRRMAKAPGPWRRRILTAMAGSASLSAAGSCLAVIRRRPQLPLSQCRGKFVDVTDELAPRPAAHRHGHRRRLG